jgi:gamma-glutamylcyclotransferase
MTKFRYFAYGSNMLMERLKPRCPSAVAIGVAEVAGRAIEFSKRSEDRSGKATLTESNRSTFGVVYEIDNAELCELDTHEGTRGGYYRDDHFAVILADGSTIHTKTYLASTPEDHLKLYDWYLALVIAGAGEHNLDPEYVAGLREVAYDVDHNASRPTRKDAIEALARAGFPDYRTILP